MNILAINPRLIVYKDFIDYPYFLNINLYINLWFLLDNSQKNLNIDVFDSFNSADAKLIKTEDYYIFWSDFNYSNYKWDYDYIIINFSPFILYNEENIHWINYVLELYKNSKIIFLNSYSWWFCYFEYKKDFLVEKWLKLDYLLNWNSHLELANILGIKTKDNNSYLKYSTLDKLINLESYLFFLKKVSDYWLLDFYKIKENTLPFYTSKWCIFNCSFCTSTNKKIKWYFEYTHDLIEWEIKYLKEKYNVEKLIIIDALFNKSLEQANKILDLFIKYNIKIEIPNGVRLDLLDECLIEKLSKLVSCLSISIESWSKKINDEVIRKWLNFKKINEICSLARKHNLKLVSHYIIGFPEETKKDINETLELAYKLFIDYWVTPLLQFATPMPGTKLSFDSKLDLMNINLFEKFQTDYFLESKNFTKEELITLKNNFYKKIEVTKTKKIIINLTYLCQNNCVFCATWDRHKLSQDFSFVVAELIKYYKKWIRLLDLDWWEPTLYKDLLRVIKIAKKIGYRYINLTSSWRNYKDINLLENILAAWVDSILISLHWSDEFIHDKITRKNWSFKETILGLDNVLKLKNKHKFNFWINITLCKINEDDLKKYLDFIKKWNPDVVNIQFMTPFGNADWSDKLEQDTEKCCKVLKTYINDYWYNIQLINLPFCYMEGFEKHVMWDVNKMERDMLFVGERPSNLYDYLSLERQKNKKCDNCIYSIICDWFYKF